MMLAAGDGLLGGDHLDHRRNRVALMIGANHGHFGLALVAYVEQRTARHLIHLVAMSVVVILTFAYVGNIPLRKKVTQAIGLKSEPGGVPERGNKKVLETRSGSQHKRGRVGAFTLWSFCQRISEPAHRKGRRPIRSGAGWCG